MVFVHLCIYSSVFCGNLYWHVLLCMLILFISQPPSLQNIATLVSQADWSGGRGHWENGSFGVWVFGSVGLCGHGFFRYDKIENMQLCIFVDKAV